MPSPENLSRIKNVIRRCLKLDPQTPIDDNMPLAGGDYELDSLDILLIVTELEKEFGIRINDKGMNRTVFASVEALGAFVERAQQGV
jgi:acyl carrier protein